MTTLTLTMAPPTAPTLAQCIADPDLAEAVCVLAEQLHRHRWILNDQSSNETEPCDGDLEHVEGVLGRSLTPEEHAQFAAAYVAEYRAAAKEAGAKSDSDLFVDRPSKN